MAILNTRPRRACATNENIRLTTPPHMDTIRLTTTVKKAKAKNLDAHLAKATTGTTKEKRSKQKRLKRRRNAPKSVGFDEAANEYHPHTLDTAQVECLWYTPDDYATFKQEQKRVVTLVRHNTAAWQNPQALPATLLRMYSRTSGWGRAS